MQPFEPGIDDWQSYTERMEQFCAANAVADEDKNRAVFLTLIGAKADALLRNLVAPAKPGDKSYAQLTES